MIKLSQQDEVLCIKTISEREGNQPGIVYMYLVDGMLIDTSTVRLEEELIPFYQEHSFDFVTLTHSHEDHSGTATWIEENLQVPIYIHPKGISICHKPGSYPRYRQVAWGIRKPFHPLPLGDKIHSRNIEWEVIYTPGHAEDHVALYDRENKRMFSGDLFLFPRTQLILKSESVPVIMKSIQKLLTYDFDSIFCSHAGYLEKGREALIEKLAYLENLYVQVEKLYHIGGSIEEINKQLFPKKYRLIELSEGEYDSINIVKSIVKDIESKKQKSKISSKS